VSAAPQPIAVLGDTVMFTALVLGLRYLILATLGAAGRAGWAARWLRRIALVAVLLLGLRLASIATMRPDIAGVVWSIAAAVLLAGAALMVADHWIVRLIPAPRRRRS
jgi:hypothetical protein